MYFGPASREVGPSSVLLILEVTLYKSCRSSYPGRSMVLLHHVARAYHRAFPVVATLQTQRNSLYSTVCPARILNGGCTDIASGWSRAIHSKRLPMRCLALGQAPRAKYFSNYGRCLATVSALCSVQLYPSLIFLTGRTSPRP
jgi:hypothetical protein